MGKPEMRFRDVHQVQFSVLDYQNSLEFYDRMVGLPVMPNADTLQKSATFRMTQLIV